MERLSRTAPFDVQVRVDDRRATMHVAGELDLYTANELVRHVEKLVDAVDTVDIDATGLSFVDSAGLHAFVRARDVGEVAGVGVRICATSEALEQVLVMTNLHELLSS